MSVTKQRALSQMKTQRSTAGRTFVFSFSLRIFVPSQDFEAVFCAVQESGGEGVGRRCGGGVVWAIRRNHSAVKHWFTGLRDTAELLEEV